MVCPCNHIVAIWTVSCRHNQPLKHWKFLASVLSLNFLFLPHFSHLLFVSPKNRDLSLFLSPLFFLFFFLSSFLTKLCISYWRTTWYVPYLSHQSLHFQWHFIYLFIVCENEIRKYLNYQKKSKNGMTILLTFKNWLHMNGYISSYW